MYPDPESQELIDQLWEKGLLHSFRRNGIRAMYGIFNALVGECVSEYQWHDPVPADKVVAWAAQAEMAYKNHHPDLEKYPVEDVAKVVTYLTICAEHRVALSFC